MDPDHEHLRTLPELCSIGHWIEWIEAIGRQKTSTSTSTSRQRRRRGQAGMFFVDVDVDVHVDVDVDVDGFSLARQAATKQSTPQRRGERRGFSLSFVA